MGATYLDNIVEHHRRRAAADRRTLAEIVDGVAERDRRDFAAALRDDPGLSIIAEIKRRSPSKGDLHPDLDPAHMARTYAAGGAAALSVLTDEPHFGGSVADLQTARAACRLPVLRKDFTVDERDVADAAAMGADACLLIVAVLGDDELGRFAARATELGLTPLFEVHDEAELDRALAAGATVVGVNQRDLHTFEVDHERAVRVGGAIPNGVVKVAESGVRGAGDAAALAAAGFDAVLVGESLVIHDDPAGHVADMRGAGGGEG